MAFYLVSVLAVVLTALVFYKAGYKKGAEVMSDFVIHTLDTMKTAVEMAKEDQDEHTT